jgi:hypothetical protein
MVATGATFPIQSQAQQSEQIRIEDVCPTIGKRLKAQLASPLYKIALERKKQGDLLPMSRARLEYVAQLRGTLKAANCGNTA